MTISVKQLANAVNNCKRIVPVIVRHITFDGEHVWCIQSGPYGEARKYIFPCYYYTLHDSVEIYCQEHDLTRDDIIVKVEEE